MKDLQTVLESLETACGNRCNAEYNPCHYREAIAIVRQMMQAEPVAFKFRCNDSYEMFHDVEPPDDAYDEGSLVPLFAAPQAVPAWLPASNPPTEAQGEVLVLMRDGTCEIAWTTYWHGSSNAFAGWMFRDPDMEDATPTHWMPLPTPPAAPKGAV